MTAADVDLVAKEVRAVLAGPDARRLFAAMDAARDTGVEPDPRPLYRLLGERRLLAVSWPRAYGGRALPGRCAAAVVGELIAGGVPEVPHTLSVQICGNFLLDAGTVEQRIAVLPGLACGALTATVLYSELDAGSDLSTLRTRAEPSDGGWVITGRKVYSVRTAFADLGLVAARTSTEVTPYQGISLFLVPLDAPGVTVDVLPALADEDFADVRLDGVRVPSAAVVGPVGGAWPLITEALALERTGVDYVAKADLWLHACDSAAQASCAPAWLRPGCCHCGASTSRTAAGSIRSAPPPRSTGVVRPPDRSRGGARTPPRGGPARAACWRPPTARRPDSRCPPARRR
jgi:alkylation response protein AidB-like acyl-CoA dehydrogenase